MQGIPRLCTHLKGETSKIDPPPSSLRNRGKLQHTLPALDMTKSEGLWLFKVLRVGECSAISRTFQHFL